ncbi:MBL fold metallo-hydrolase [Candidatus Uhrbacteria bacterium]|nr:MBL fold metallo-hydrolase [Candidatus Uhrbacteria bacterium]
MSRSRRILDGLLMVGGSGLSHPGDCCVYLLDAGDGAFVLVDAGLRAAGIEENIASAGREPSRIAALVLTHCHIDHVGGARRFADLGAEVVAHPLDADAIGSGDAERLALDWYGVDYIPVEPSRLVSDGDRLGYGDIVLNVAHAPGHTPGSIAPWADIDGKRVLFGQDVHGPFDEAWRSSIEDWRASMERLLALEADVLCEGHYGVIEGKGAVADFIGGFLASHRPHWGT